MDPRNSASFSPAPYPAVRIALFFAAGITGQRLFPLPAAAWIALFGAALLTLGLTERRQQGRPAQSRQVLLLSAYCLLILLGGGSRYALQNAAGERTDPTAELSGHTWSTLEFSGELRRIGRSSSGRLQMDLSVRRTLLPDSTLLSIPYGLRVFGDTVSGPGRHPLRPGGRLRLRATLYPPPEGLRNPGGFNRRAWLASLDIRLQAGLDTLLEAGSPRGWNWGRARGKAQRLVERNFSPETAPLAKALLLGYKDELDPGDRLAFTRIGLGHVMAVSGLHVGFLLAPFWAVIPLFRGRKHGKPAGMILLILLLTGYAGITGFSASVCRASLTGGCLMYARLCHRARNPVNLAAASAVVIMAWDPGQLFSAGFQLSYAAVFIILLGLPAVYRLLPAGLRHRPGGAVLTTLAISVLVPVGLYPLVAFYFGEFSLAGPLVNALALPFLLVLVPSALLLLGLSLLHPAAGAFLNIPNDFGLGMLDHAAGKIASLPWSWISTPSPDPWTFALWAAGLMLLASLSIPRLRWKFLLLLLALSCGMSGDRLLENRFRGSRLSLLIFDVGQGDAALIRTPGGRNLLIDAGRWDPGYDSGRQVLLPYLRSAGIDSLHAVFITHPHADHIGGLPSLVGRVGIGVIYHPGADHDSGLYRRLRAEAAGRGIPFRPLAAGDIPAVEPSLRIMACGPLPDGEGDLNERSLVLALAYGRTRFLFMGDAEGRAERAVAARYGNLLRAGLLKVGHHGAAASSSAPFLRAARPGIAVISAGRYNTFGHPHPGTLHRLQSSTGRVYLTSRDRALLFRSDGSRIRRVSWR